MELPVLVLLGIIYCLKKTRSLRDFLPWGMEAKSTYAVSMTILGKD